MQKSSLRTPSLLPDNDPDNQSQAEPGRPKAQH
jgi:hypothetical protein